MKARIKKDQAELNMQCPSRERDIGRTFPAIPAPVFRMKNNDNQVPMEKKDYYEDPGRHTGCFAG